jgi:hypothetical protein
MSTLIGKKILVTNCTYIGKLKEFLDGTVRVVEVVNGEDDDGFCVGVACPEYDEYIEDVKEDHWALLGTEYTFVEDEA